MTITIDAAACCGDSICVRACPARVLELENGTATTLPTVRVACIRCGHCAAVCPTGAIRLEGDTSTPIEDAIAGLSPLEQAILTRRSIRWYKPTPVPREALAAALDVARYAPTAKNLQQVAYTAVDNPETLRTVADMIAQWMLTIPDSAAVGKAYLAGCDVILRGAPNLVLAHAPADFGFSPQDCTAAITSLELVLHNRGIGACWAGYVTAATQFVPELRAVLGIPPERRVYAGLLFGYVAGETYSRVPDRKPASLTWV